MRNRVWILHSLIMVGSYMVLAREPTFAQEMRAEAGMTTSLVPPAGNSTFLGKTTWCIARPGASKYDLQNALDWACGIGKADCAPIRKGGRCFNPDTLVSHASYAFNSYYQQNGNNEIACNFGGAGFVTTKDPSYEKCVYAASGYEKSSATPNKNKSSMLCWKIIAILLLVYSLDNITISYNIVL